MEVVIFVYIFIYMEVVFPASADEGKDKNPSWSQPGIPSASTAAGSKEEQTDYIKDGTAKQTLP